MPDEPRARGKWGRAFGVLKQQWGRWGCCLDPKRARSVPQLHHDRKLRLRGALRGGVTLSLCSDPYSAEAFRAPNIPAGNESGRRECGHFRNTSAIQAERLNRRQSARRFAIGRFGICNDFDCSLDGPVVLLHSESLGCFILSLMKQQWSAGAAAPAQASIL